MPAYAKDRRKTIGKTSRTASAPATVSALPMTVLPAVAIVRRTASLVSWRARGQLLAEAARR